MSDLKSWSVEKIHNAMFGISFLQTREDLIVIFMIMFAVCKLENNIYVKQVTELFFSFSQSIMRRSRNILTHEEIDATLFGSKSEEDSIDNPTFSFPKAISFQNISKVWAQLVGSWLVGWSLGTSKRGKLSNANGQKIQAKDIRHPPQKVLKMLVWVRVGIG